MFKALCIKTGEWRTDTTYSRVNFPTPSFGDEVTVIDTGNAIDGHSIYFLKEFYNPYGGGWYAEHFVPLDDQPAEELEQLEEKLEPELVEA